MFSKDNFVLASIDSCQKKQAWLVLVGVVVTFVLASLTFMNALYCFADIIGAIVSGSADVAVKDLLRVVPVFLSFLESLWALLLFHGLYRAESEERVLKSLKKNAIVLIVFATLLILFVMVRRFSGGYLSLVEGSPSALYPLDSMLYSLLFLAIGVLVLLYLKKWQEKWPLKLVSRAPVVRKVRFLYCFGLTLWLLIALFGFSGFAIGLFIIDFKHGWQFYSISLLLAYFVAFASIAVWELYYNNLTEEAKKANLLKMALISLLVSVLVAVLYFVSLSLDLDAPSNMGFGVLPVAFAASVNMATMLVVATPILVSIIAVIKGLVIRKK